jgi:hypothetical protein
MIVHFIASKSHIREELPYYRAITHAIKKHGHHLAKDWVEEVHDLSKDGQLKKKNETWKEADRENVAAISSADVIIVEATSRSFFAGYQVAQAVQQKKPLLALIHEEAYGSVAGISTPFGFVKSVVYNLETIDEIIGEFLSENTIETKDLRFNFILDRQTYTYLRWMSEKTGKSKGEVIRSMIYNEMQKED